MVSASFTNFFNSFTTFFLSSLTSYVGVNLFSISIPRSFFGKSRICQNEAFTIKSFHKNFSIVFPLAGDSTITRFFIGVFLFLNFPNFINYQHYVKRFLFLY